MGYKKTSTCLAANIKARKILLFVVHESPCTSYCVQYVAIYNMYISSFPQKIKIKDKNCGKKIYILFYTPQKLVDDNNVEPDRLAGQKALISQVLKTTKP